MDISAIIPAMGNEASSSLNDDFSGQTQSGDTIFSKPLADRTFFRTPTNGLVMVSFIFDPKKSYAEDSQMASVTSDWMADMRDGLMRLLLDEKDLVPKTKTLEETIWDQMTSVLPKETLAKNLFANKEVFDQYTTLLKANVTKVYNEEKIFTDKLRTEAFNFSFEIAIDAYPQALAGGKEEKRTDKTGVLTFNIVGIPDGKMPSVDGTPKEDENTEATHKGKKRKVENSKPNKDKKAKTSDAQKVLLELGVKDFHDKATKDNLKKFPHSASQFFDNLNRWFSSLVSRKATKLEKDRQRSHLYH